MTNQGWIGMPRLKPGPISEATTKEEADSSAALRNDKPRAAEEWQPRGSAEVGGEQDVLFDDALFEDGFVGVGGFVADLDRLVLHLLDEGLGLGLLRELVGVLAVVGLVFEAVAVFQRSHEQRGMRDPGNFAADDAAVDRRPSLGSFFVMAPAPAADVDGNRSEE